MVTQKSVEGWLPIQRAWGNLSLEDRVQVVEGSAQRQSSMNFSGICIYILGGDT